MLRFADPGAAAGTAQAEAAHMLAARIDERLDGTMCMSMTFGVEGESDETAVDALLTGRADLAAPDAASLGSISPVFLTFDVPFKFNGIEDVLAANGGTEGDSILTATEGSGVTGLALWLDGFEVITADRPLTDPEEMARVMLAAGSSSIERAMLDQLGTGYILLTRPEVFHALRDQVIEGQISTWPTILSEGLIDVQRVATLTEHSVSQRVLLISTEVWEGLPDETRDELAMVISEVSHERNRLVFELGEAAKESLISQGLEVHTLTDAERAAWIAAVRPAWDLFEDTVN